MKNLKISLNAQCAAIGKIIGGEYFKASVSIWYSDGSGEGNIQFVFTENDPEFMAMLNAYGARKCAEKMLKTLDPDNNAGEISEDQAYINQMKQTGRAY